MYTLDSYIAALAPQLPPALVSPAMLQRIRPVAAQLPPLTMVGFESVLGSAEPVVDFAVAIRREADERRLFAGPSPAGAQGHSWERLQAFCAQIAAPEDPLYSVIGTLWLEFDLSAGGAEQPGPNLLFGLRPPDEHVQGPAAEALGLLLGGPLPPALGEALDRCLGALPAGAVLFQVGAMLARPAAGVRLCIRQIAPAAVAPYLASIGWGGDPAPVAALCAELAPLVASLILNVDVAGPYVAPRIGLECYLDRDRRPTLDPRWPTFLDWLVARELCTPAKRDALLGWSGRTAITTDKAGVLLRGLNHIKLVHHPAAPLVAKGYFGFVHAAATPL